MKVKLILSVALLIVAVSTLFIVSPSVVNWVVESTAEQILSESTSALSKLDSYKVGTNLVEAYTVIDGTNSTMTTTWRINKSCSIATKEIQSSMNVEQNGLNMMSFDVYIIGGWTYLNQVLPVVYDGSSASWGKLRLTNETWTRESQISSQIELLKTPIEVDLAGSENVDGVDCYVLNVTATAKNMADWVLSWQQQGGPSLHWWKTTAERSREIYTKAYKNSFIKLWIAKDSHLVIKTDISALFEVTPSILKPADVPLCNVGEVTYGFDKITADFHWQINYSNYNLPVSIELPEEALNAQEY